MGKTAIKIQTFGKMYLLGYFMGFCDNFVIFLEIIVYVEKNYMPGGIVAKGNYMQGKFVQKEFICNTN